MLYWRVTSTPHGAENAPTQKADPSHVRTQTPTAGIVAKRVLGSPAGQHVVVISEADEDAALPVAPLPVVLPVDAPDPAEVFPVLPADPALPPDPCEAPAPVDALAPDIDPVEVANWLPDVWVVEPPGPCDPVDPLPADALKDTFDVLPVDGELPDPTDVLLVEPIEALP